MENIEKCVDFVVRVYDPIHSVSGKLRLFFIFRPCLHVIAFISQTKKIHFVPWNSFQNSNCFIIKSWHSKLTRSYDAEILEETLHLLRLNCSIPTFMVWQIKLNSFICVHSQLKWWSICSFFKLTCVYRGDCLQQKSIFAKLLWSKFAKIKCKQIIFMNRVRKELVQSN